MTTGVADATKTVSATLNDGDSVVDVALNTVAETTGKWEAAGVIPLAALGDCSLAGHADDRHDQVHQRQLGRQRVVRGGHRVAIYDQHHDLGDVDLDAEPDLQLYQYNGRGDLHL